MKTPKIALDLNLNPSKVKDKPAWQRHLYARLAERAGDNTARITYADRDASAKNPRRDQIQKWYEQIYSELAQAYAKSEEALATVESDMGEVHRSANRLEERLSNVNLQLEQVRAERDALIDMIARAHTAGKQVEYYTNLYGQA